MKKRILFITQNLARTGSEMVLWYLLKNLDAEKYAVSVFCIRKGELYDTLPEYVGKNIMYRSSPDWTFRTFRRLLKFFGVNPLTYQLNSIQHKFKADIWYVNTITIPEVFEEAKQQGVKIVTHIHELLYAFTFIKSGELKQIISYSDVCIGCSEIVCEKIKDLKHSNIKMQYSFIDTEIIHTDPLRIAAIKKELGILSTDFVWVISGGVTYMKGLDHVLPILEHFKEEAVKIVWIGPQLNNGLDFYVKDVADRKYPNRLIFTGALSLDYYNYMSIANGFLLISREESFSLVMVEAAYLGIPIVAFNIGIAGQFIKENMGVVIDSCDLKDVVKGMKWIHDHPHQDKAKLKESAIQFSVKRQLPEYEKLLQEIAQSE